MPNLNNPFHLLTLGTSNNGTRGLNWLGWLAQPKFNEITAVPLIEAIFLWELSLSRSRSHKSSNEKCSRCVWQAFTISIISSSPLPNSRIVAIGDFSWTQLLLKWLLIVTLSLFHDFISTWLPILKSFLPKIPGVIFVSYSESWVIQEFKVCEWVISQSCERYHSLFLLLGFQIYIFLIWQTQNHILLTNSKNTY